LCSVYKGFCVDVVLDLANACDKISHQRLLKELKKHRITAELWFVKLQKTKGLY